MKKKDRKGLELSAYPNSDFRTAKRRKQKIRFDFEGKDEPRMMKKNNLTDLPKKRLRRNQWEDWVD